LLNEELADARQPIIEFPQKNLSKKIAWTLATVLFK
jgi:hypothetical protein